MLNKIIHFFLIIPFIVKSWCSIRAARIERIINPAYRWHTLKRSLPLLLAPGKQFNEQFE